MRGKLTKTLQQRNLQKHYQVNKLLNRFSLDINSRKDFPNWVETRVAKILDAVCKDPAEALQSYQPRLNTRHHTPNVLEPDTGKVAAKTECQWTPKDERQPKVAAVFSEVVRSRGAIVQVLVGLKSFRFSYQIHEMHLRKKLRTFSVKQFNEKVHKLPN